MSARYIKLMSNYWFIYVTGSIVYAIVFNYADVYINIKENIIDFFGVAFAFGTPSLNNTWWYMSFAIIQIFLMPIFIGFVKAHGIAIVPIIIISTRWMGWSQNVFVGYWLTIAAGTIFAEKQIFEKIRNIDKIPFARLSKVIISFIIIIIFSYIRGNSDYSDIIETILTISLCYICVEVLSKLPILNISLKTIGKHATNLFLVHTFVFKMYFTNFIYSWKNWFIIIIVLVIVCLAISLLIEYIKKTTGYNRFFSEIISHINY